MSILRMRLGEARIVAWMTTLTNANVFAAGQRYKSKKDLHRAIRSAGIAAADTDRCRGLAGAFEFSRFALRSTSSS